MSAEFNVTIDSNDAHTIAEWWAQTLDWVVEPTEETLIDWALANGHATAEDVMVHRGRRVWASGSAICPPDQVGKPGRRRILFNNVPEPKTVKNRMHLDLRFPGHEADAVRAELQRRGATFVYEGSQGPASGWYTMQDPQGNEFCICW